VGGGMGACTLATAAVRRGARRVTLLSRGIIRRREQECDVAYFGNKVRWCMLTVSNHCVLS